ncbi:MAG: ABC transporter substrate-binding protein [SAR324 cluster bacterium]|nr:ABC transporter substrate-binding protein [SAR324 cluster bacterium]
MAKQWNISKDGLTVTVHLVENALFHDGHPITSEDVAFSVMTVKTLHPFKSMMAPVQRVDTPDRYTAVFRLNKPHPAIILAMSPALLPILPKHIYGSPEKVKAHPANKQTVGSGPFILKKFVPGEKIILERNPRFFIPGRPYLDQLRLTIPKNTLQEAMDMETGKAHMISLYDNIEELKQMQSLEHITVIKDAFKGIGSIYWLAFNLRSKPFDDVRVRKAIAYAIDRKFLIETIYQGEAATATGPISTASPFYSSDVNKYYQDFKKANRLLDEAGYRRDSSGKRFSFRLTYIPAKTQTHRQLMEYLQQIFLRELGVEAKIEHPKDFINWSKTVGNWDFDVSLDIVYNWGDPVIGVHRTYLSSNIRKGVIWSNTQGYSNPVADALMEKASKELNFVKRKKLYAEFQTLIADELPIYPLYQFDFAIAHDKRLKGVGNSIWGMMSPMDDVYWDKKP